MIHIGIYMINVTINFISFVDQDFNSNLACSGRNNRRWWLWRWWRGGLRGINQLMMMCTLIFHLYGFSTSENKYGRLFEDAVFVLKWYVFATLIWFSISMEISLTFMTFWPKFLSTLNMIFITPKMINQRNC